MPERLPFGGPPFMVDQSETTKTGFWWENARPLGSVRAELLDAIGWLGTTKVQLFTRDERGAIAPVPAGAKPSDVLFILGKEGTKRYRQWEEWLVYLELQLSRRALSAAHVEDLRIAIESAESEICRLREGADARYARLSADRDSELSRMERSRDNALAAGREAFSRLEAQIRMAAGMAREQEAVQIPSGVFGETGPTSVTVQVSRGAVPDGVRRGMDDARDLSRELRETGGAFEAQLSLLHRIHDERKTELDRELAARLASLEGRRSSLREDLETAVRNDKRRYYPAAFARGRAFLDREALEAAAVASEEMRKTPRHASAIAEQMERRLASE